MTAFWIARRELGALFTTVVGWLVLTGFVLVTGVFWNGLVAAFQMAAAGDVYNAYGGAGVSLTNDLILPFYGNCTVILLMVTPALSMRLFSEEIRNETLTLLLTSPITTTEIVLGKFLGALAFLAVLLGATAYVPIVLYLYGNPDPGVLVGAYLALFALGAALLAMGMCISAYTQNQIVSILLTFMLGMTLYVAGFWWVDPESIFNKISLSARIADLLRGAVRTADVAYFVSFIGFFLFATHQRLESHRWS